MTNNTESKFYALLIGINYYESIQASSQLYKNLGGCVGDVDLVDSYLQKTLKVPPEQIWKLTASIPKTNELAAFDSASSHLLPTYENIVTAFAEITAVANPGDRVYIHYSGHGGRAATIYPELEGTAREDESIVPMDIGSANGRYLRDVEIATLLKRLSDRGCITTVIFDSCHSGGATRGDCAIRGNENNLVDTTARSKDSLVASRQELLDNWKILTKTDSALAGGWLPNQDYVFLAACRPTEFAYEYAVNSGQRHGALTYWMMDTLTSSTSVLTYKSLYNRVKGMIQSKFPQQLPMLTGNGDREVFGDRRKYKPYTVGVIRVNLDKQELTLDAGLAQGLSTGTRFAIYPYNCDDLADQTKQIAIAELTDNIQADKSTAKILDAAAGGIEVKGKIEPGTSAVMVAAPVDLIRKVRLFDRKEAGEREQDLPADLVAKQTAALEKVRQALAGNGWVEEVQDGEESHFQVAVAKNGTYEICIGMPINNLNPALSIKDAEAPKKVVERLVHLAKYQSVQALDNPASKISEYLEFELLDSNKKPFSHPNEIELKQGETVFLRLKNNFSQALNVAILDLEPTWEISQIPINNLESPFFQLDSNQKIVDIQLQFELPERDNYKTAKEKLKVFATRGVANFQWLLLPSLDEDMQSRGNLNQKLEQKIEQMTTRGETITVNPLNDLLSTIGADIDEPPVITRKAKVKPDPNADWATKEIQITVQ